MGCIIGCLAILFPRVALFLVWLFGGDYLSRAVDGQWGWLVLGFFFLPLTTLTFAYSMNSLSPAGDVPPLGWILIVVAGLLDLGLFGGGARSARKKRDDE